MTTPTEVSSPEVWSHPLYQPIRKCTACPLHAKCLGPVPGVGPSQAQIMFVSEAPGKYEDQAALPFIGPAGRILDHELKRIGIKRESVYITNVLKCHPNNDRDPTQEEIHTCAPLWLHTEIDMVQPKILVPMGKFAIQYLTGLNDDVQHLQGYPLLNVTLPNGYVCPVVLPLYHPASALYRTTLLRQIREGFDRLGKLVNTGELSPPKDEYPNPAYLEIDSSVNVFPVEDLALDTETVEGKLWSIQISHEPGTAWFTRADDDDWVDIDSNKVIVHNWLYDQQFLPLPNYIDTMVMAYLLGLPQSLKTLARDLCGMDMRSYLDLVSPYRQEKALQYLAQASEHEYPNPEPVAESNWDNKKGRIVTKQRKPQNIGRKIKRILADMVSKQADPWSRWWDITEQEREIVEREIGIMPDSNLSDISLEDAIFYSCRDADATLRVYLALKPLIEQAGLEYVLHTTDLPVLKVARRMMETGIRTDSSYLEGLSRDFEALMESEAGELAEMAGMAVNGLNMPLTGEAVFVPYPFNPNSHTQVSDLLHNKLNFPITRRTRTDLPSTADTELSKIDHPLVPQILHYRELSKLKGSYSDKFPGYIDPDSRIRPTIKPTFVETGRWAMVDPPMMTIPGRTDLGRKIKNAFISSEGKILLEADYSQIEMRLAMHLSKCVAGIGLFREGRDIHTETAAQINGVSLEDAASSKYRYPAKTMGFGVIYMISPQGLLDQMISEKAEGEWDKDKCTEFIGDYFTLYPELKVYQKHIIESARRDGYVTDMFNRRRFVPELDCPIVAIRSAGERQAANMPYQSGAQGIIKTAMVKLPIDPEVLWLLQMHDALIWEVPENDAAFYAARYSEIMSSVVGLSVPVVVDSKTGYSWGEMK